MQNIFFDIGILIIASTLLGFISKLLKQPLIPSYIIAGIVLGPFGLGLIKDANTIMMLSEIGIAFLLFVVGIELDFRKLKDIGFAVSVGGTLQILLLFFMGFFIGNMLGIFTNTEAIYVGLIVAFSSTMVVVKLLSDKRELDTLHGRLIIGILLMEDLFAILSMSSINVLKNFSIIILLFALFKGLMLVIISLLFGRFVSPRLFSLGAKSQEILFLLSLAICFSFTILAQSFGYSIVVGAFLAGVSLANLPYHFEIAARVKPLRDFFSTLFFSALGLGLVFSSVKVVIFPLIILFFFVALFKPFIIMLLTSAFGYSTRTAFLTSINLAQISEFSLIIVAQGRLLGHVSDNMFSLTVILATMSIIFTTYIIKYDNELFFSLSRFLKIFDSLNSSKKKLQYGESESKYNTILIGYDRIAYSISKALRKMHKHFFVVDFNPDLIKKLIKAKIPCMYGDIGDIEIIGQLNFRETEIVISTVPVKKDNLLVIQHIKKENGKCLIFVTANQIEEALDLYDAGADYVILPHFLGGDHVSLLLEDITKDLDKLLKNKLRHIEELKDRKDIGHYHPYHNKENI